MMAKLSRRDFLGAMSASLLLPSLARAAGAPESTSFELLGVRDPQLGMQLAVADYLGLFKAEGIDVKIRWQESSGDVLTIMGGGFPIGIGNPAGTAWCSHRVSSRRPRETWRERDAPLPRA